MDTQTKNEKIFKKMVRAGSRTYFIDVNVSVKGSKYMTICESRKKDGEFQSNRIMIFENDVQAFYDALREAAPVIKG